jgi:hypothetical protein
MRATYGVGSAVVVVRIEDEARCDPHTDRLRIGMKATTAAQHRERRTTCRPADCAPAAGRDS